VGYPTAHFFKTKLFCLPIFSPTQSWCLWSLSLHPPVSFFIEHTWSHWFGHVGQWCCVGEVLGACCRLWPASSSWQEGCWIGLWLWIGRVKIASLSLSFLSFYSYFVMENCSLNWAGKRRKLFTIQPDNWVNLKRSLWNWTSLCYKWRCSIRNVGDFWHAKTQTFWY